MQAGQDEAPGLVRPRLMASRLSAECSIVADPSGLARVTAPEAPRMNGQSRSRRVCRACGSP